MSLLLGNYVPKENVIYFNNTPQSLKPLLDFFTEGPPDQRSIESSIVSNTFNINNYSRHSDFLDDETSAEMQLLQNELTKEREKNKRLEEENRWLKENKAQEIKRLQKIITAQHEYINHCMQMQM